jgi:hypothetical protein
LSRPSLRRRLIAKAFGSKTPPAAKGGNMPTCGECGTHWFNPVIHKCPVCGTLTIEGLAGALSEQIRSAPDLLQNLEAVGAQLFSDDAVLRKAALDVLARAQTHSAFELLLSAARRTRSEALYDTLCALYYYPQYAEELMPVLLAVASQPDDGSHSQSMAVTVIGNLGQTAIAYLIDHRSEVLTPKLFWDAIVSAADKLGDTEATSVADFLTAELAASNLEPECLDSLLRLREKRWFPVHELVEYASALLDSPSEPSVRNAAANVLFHCTSKSDAAKRRLATLMRDDVLGIRCRAVQACQHDNADQALVNLLCAAANLESIVERGADERIWTREQLVRDIERTARQSFTSAHECLAWVRKNCFVE